MPDQAIELTDVHRASDINVLAELAARIWHAYFPPLIGQAQVDYMLATLQSPAAIAQQIDAGEQYSFIRCDGNIVGYVACAARQRGDDTKISKLYLRASARGRGAASGVLALLESDAQANDSQRLYLTVNRRNARAISFYRKSGFSICGEVDIDIGGGFVMNDYEMEKILLP